MRFAIFSLCVLVAFVLSSPEVRADEQGEQHPSLTKLLNTIEMDKCTGFMDKRLIGADGDAAQEQCNEFYKLLKDLPVEHQKECQDGVNPTCAQVGRESHIMGNKSRTAWSRCAVTLPDLSQVSIYSCVFLALREHKLKLQARFLELKAKKAAMRMNSGLSSPAAVTQDFEIDPIPVRNKVSMTLSPNAAKMKKKSQTSFDWDTGRMASTRLGGYRG